VNRGIAAADLPPGPVQDLAGGVINSNVVINGSQTINIGGVTIHSFAGIGLGKESAEKLAAAIQRKQVVAKRWRECQVLVIDEVSMLDGHLFDKLEEVARRVRSSTAVFGGVQLVLAGDFYQLPPVGLDQEQHVLLEEALLAREPALRVDELSPEQENAHLQLNLVYMVLSTADVARVKAAVSERQWRTLAMLMNQGKSMRSWIEQQGVLEGKAP
jgi:hypothetical protein